MRNKIMIGIIFSGLLVSNSPEIDQQLPSTEALRGFSFTQADVPLFVKVGEPYAKFETLTDMPTFQRAFPNKPFYPGSLIWFRQVLTQPASETSPAARIQAYITIHSNLDHALVFDSPKIMNEGISNAFGYRVGTFSRIPIGDASRFVPNPSDPNRDRVPAARIAARAGNVIVSAQYNGQPIKSGRGHSWPKLTSEDKRATECAVRIALSNGIMASVDFRRISNSAIRVSGRETVCKTLPNRDEVVLIDRIAKIKNEYGILEFSFNGKKLKTGIGAKEIQIGSRRIPLSVPVLYDRGQIWIERSGLAQATR